MDFEARHVIEALRSGVSSRAVGQYFSSARPQIMADISNSLNTVCTKKSTSGMIVSGKYGEGKTHLLNTVFNMACQSNMVVSLVSLSKETPFDKLYLVYQKIMNNTYLPGHLQPGFEHIFENMTQGSPITSQLLEYSLKYSDTNKLYYILKAYLGTEDYDEKFMLLADIEGDFIANATLKQIYKRIYNEKANLPINFSKTKHTAEYLEFLSQLFLKLGYNGWVILFDEAELIGRLGKKARLNAYENMAQFIAPNDNSRLKATFSMFALGASFVEDVVESKHEQENLLTSITSPESRNTIQKTLNLIISAPQLVPLSDDEILNIIAKVKDFHGRAYNWQPQIDTKELFAITDKRSRLLRSRIREIVEHLDQLYQYGQISDVSVTTLDEMLCKEDTPSLDMLESEF